MFHYFTPQRYYNTLGVHPPALTLADGDTVLTTCVDAWGQDASGERVTQGPNPMTGPFFVAGAHPGDTLAVSLDRIAPNRDWGWVRTPLAYNTVDPDFARTLPERDRAVVRWQVDVAAGVAMLDSPQPRLGALTLPLSPMIGCFGVAPAGGEAISTATSGPHGGNMDYNGFVSGVTVYFPVFVEGALFHIGDGHALQGDGEISGTGVEISMEVQFTVRVIRHKTIGWPRGENADFIFTVGNARPLDQALQHATTEMARWLRDDYGLDAHEVGILMGQAARYDLGNFFDPAYTMVCKIPRRYLPK
ncbi:MAG: acetamidase/formamidase family protein [Anaerolineae bacterium]|nr:acetamidase/formamidase family protein [Candidatus Roseilinea sp.]MDW8352609.1 acetamidase/formamidase family protein [Anaerolineae bacterium]MDW8448366.1 acetamidase/formamidase family protein [Anaerolineae bacterium]